MILTFWRKQNCPDFIGQNVSDVFVLRFVYLSDCFWTFRSHISGRSVPKSNAGDHFLKKMKFIMRHSIKKLWLHLFYSCTAKIEREKYIKFVSLRARN